MGKRFLCYLIVNNGIYSVANITCISPQIFLCWSVMIPLLNSASHHADSKVYFVSMFSVLGPFLQPSYKKPGFFSYREVHSYKIELKSTLPFFLKLRVAILQNLPIFLSEKSAFPCRSAAVISSIWNELRSTAQKQAPRIYS